MRNTLISVKRAAVASVAIVCALALSAPAQARPTDKPDGPPSDKITVDVITVNGSGCPAGTAEVFQSPDNTSFKVRYHKYVAEAGAAPTDIRKNCQLALRFHVPQGFTYAVYKVDYRGYADLRQGATAYQLGHYYFQGQSPTVRIKHQLDDGWWHTTDETEEANLVWAPCGEIRNLNINTELRVYQPAGTIGKSRVSMRTTEGDVDTLYHFSWKRC